MPLLSIASSSCLLPASLASQLSVARNRALRPTSLPYRTSCSVASAAMSSSIGAPSSPWITFPHLSHSGKRLMESITDTIATQLSPALNPSLTPEDVRQFQNAQGSCQGSVIIRSGASGSPIDLLLGSWLHCNLPFGTLNISTIVGMINSETDAPHLLFEFIQTNASSLVVVMDLLPRKDLVVDTEYLKRFYENTALEAIKQEIQKSPKTQTYEPPTLYIRCLTSPTSILCKFEDDSLDYVIEEVITPTANKFIKVWLDAVLDIGRGISETELQSVLQRDMMIKTKGVEVDLSSNLPRLFGQEISDRVVAAFKQGK